MNATNRKGVRFAPTCQVVIVVDKTKGIEDKLWYSSEDIDQFKLYSALHSEAIRNSVCDSSFDGEFADILGLERFLFGNIYLANRQTLKWAVLEEQNWQKLTREMRRRRGLPSEVDGRDNLTLADVAAKSSSWAKERAYIAGLTLQSNLCTGNISGTKASNSNWIDGRNIQNDGNIFSYKCHNMTTHMEEDCT